MNPNLPPTSMNVTRPTALRWLQENQPWVLEYDSAFRAGGNHRLFAHCVLHMQKALGRLADVAEKLDHDQHRTTPDMRDEIASIIVSAIQAASAYPGGGFDVQDRVILGMESKNNWDSGQRLEKI